jgi:hypothetical protein
MRTPAVHRWRPRAEIALWRYGWAWAVGAVLALVAACAWLLVLQPLQQARDAALLELGQAHRARDAGRSSPSNGFALDDGARLQVLQTLLQQSPETGEIVRRMATLARAEQITLTQADYKQQPIAGIGVTRVQIMQPVRASYPQLRRYIEAVLAATPNASLDQVVAKRDNVGQTQVEARLTWSLWVARRAEPAPATVARREATP